MSFYQKVVQARAGDLLPIAESIAHFQQQAENGMEELKPTGTIWNLSKRLPGIMAQYYSELQEVEAILEFVTMQADKMQTEKKKNYLEHYSRVLSDRTANEYAQADDDVFTLRLLQNEVALARNNLLSVFKGLDSMNYQIKNLVTLRSNGIEDTQL